MGVIPKNSLILIFFDNKILYFKKQGIFMSDKHFKLLNTRGNHSVHSQLARLDDTYIFV